MADEQQLAILRQGSDAWNAWREQNRRHLFGVNLFEANLSGADLSGANLSEALLIGANLAKANLVKVNLAGARLARANLNEADLAGASLYRADLLEANLAKANLTGASLLRAELIRVTLFGANLSGARLAWANLYWANLMNANLSGANLMRANLVGTNFTGANLRGCRIHGISAWNLKLDLATQKDLIITRYNEPKITVDNLEVAQFIYLLLHNERIRHVIDTITSKVVLILGRFQPPERKAVLDALREELRKRDYTPVLFDFEQPRSRSTLETISTLAHMARFVIADLTDAKSVLQELQAIVPTNPSVPVQPLILAMQEERRSRACSTSSAVIAGCWSLTATRTPRGCSPPSRTE
jgi:uncharacterized protein YjbI with pentapeptide repeats